MNTGIPAGPGAIAVDRNLRIYLVVALAALAVGTYVLCPSLVNRYVINDDVMQHVYWLRQFREPGLFQNDLLTDYARCFQPWGFTLLYYLGSLVIDPLWLSRILPIVLLAIAAVYMYKLAALLSGRAAAGFIAAALLLTTPLYLNRMAGGEPRAFAFPLAIMFLYYLSIRSRGPCAGVLLLQSLFYPMMFLVCGLTAVLSLPRRLPGRITIDRSVSAWFVAALILGTLLIAGKQRLSYDPAIGPLITRQQMEGQLEYYAVGRFRILPTPSLIGQMADSFVDGTRVSQCIRAVFKNYPRISQTLVYDEMLLVAGIIVYGCFKKKIRIPVPLILFYIASIVMFLLADLALFRLYHPERYLQYSHPLVALVSWSLAISIILERFASPLWRNLVVLVIIVGLLLGLGRQQGNGLVDHSRHAGLYEYLAQLPQDSVIAAYPYLADGIPVFSGKTVFVNYEMSQTYYTAYWRTVKQRTSEFFQAYFSADPGEIHQFCLRHRIDYLVVDMNHFRPEYISGGNYYFEPFNTEIESLLAGRSRFALREMPDEKKLFLQGSMYVIHRDSLR